MNHRKLKKMLKAEKQYFVRDTKSSVLSCKPEQTVKKRLNFRFSMATAFAMLIVVLGVVGILQSKPNIPPVYSNSIIVVDINPSIEFEVDEKGNLVSYRPLNSDAVVLLSNMTLTLNSPFKAEFDKVILEAKAYGYLTTSAAKVSVINENKKDEKTLVELIKEYFASNEKIDVVKTEASKDKNVSDGKYNIIGQIMALDLGYQYETLVKKDIKKLNEILKDYKEDQMDELEDQIDSIKNQQAGRKESLLDQLERLEEKVETILEQIEEAISDDNEAIALSLYNQLKNEHFINLSELSSIEEVESFYERFKDYFEDFIETKADEIEDGFEIDVKSSIEAWKNNGYQGELNLIGSIEDNFIENLKQGITSNIKVNVYERQFFNLVERIEKHLEILEDSGNSYIHRFYVQNLYMEFMVYMNSDLISEEAKQDEDVIDMIADYEVLMLP